MVGALLAVAPALGRVFAGPERATKIAVGHTVLLAPQTKTSGCARGPEPDRRCSPGAYYSRLTKAVVCSARFHTDQVRDVSETTKHRIEAEYGMPVRKYGRTLEIDHIVALEIGGSNDPVNLFPERRNAQPGYPAKDRLENRVHDLVCSGAIRLRIAQRRMASDWIGFYTDVFGEAPS